MSHPFEITDDDIERLDDRQLTELLRLLLREETISQGLAVASVRVPLKITIPDGGSDATVEWVDGSEATPWIPARRTVFQVKATDMSPAACKEEILQPRAGRGRSDGR